MSSKSSDPAHVAESELHAVPGDPLPRRQFLGLCAGAVASVAAAPAVASQAPLQRYLSGRPERRLAFLNLHTGEKLQRTYWVQGEYDEDALQEIDHILRDFRTGDVLSMDRSLLDVLSALRFKTGLPHPFHVISGYRSPKTNAMLRKSSSGVAKKSLHMQGRAIDVRMSGLSVSDLRKAALSLRAGGVGYYPASGFIHLDTGRVRTW